MVYFGTPHIRQATNLCLTTLAVDELDIFLYNSSIIVLKDLDMPALKTAIRRPHLTDDIVPFSECRNNLAGCFSQVRETHRPLIVTQKGRASTVIISAEDFDPLMDIVLLAKTVRQSRAEIAAGEGVEHSEAMRRFRERHGL